MITHFELDDKHREQRETVRAFCDREIEPRIEEFEDAETFPNELVEAIGEAGYGGVPYPTAVGGGGQDFRTYAITMEELARSWKLLAGGVNVACGLVGYPIETFGSNRQRNDWLPGIFGGETIPALAMTEPEAGSDAASMETTAHRDGDEWVIDGHKVWITHGSIADFLLVVARTESDDGHAGLSLIGIPDPLERSGFEVVRDIPCMEGPSAVESELRFDGLRVPINNLVGEAGRGFRYVMEALDIGRIGTAAQGVGVAEGALAASREFAGEREQFGQPIKEFQGIGFKLAEMATETEAARLLTLHAASERDRGERVTRVAAMAKYYATDTAMDLSTEAVQIHGARGYSKDYPVERYMREAKGMQIYEGTNEINRLVIANRLYE
jgi:alkylation response protein AidB-like acyl-CoA dehydrogenase